MRVGIVGAGYVGLCMAMAYRSCGTDISIYEIDEHKIKLINAGIAPFKESGLQELMDRYPLVVQDSILKLVERSDIIFICVGTPSNSDGSINLDYIKTAAKDIAKSLLEIPIKHRPTIVIKSTVIPGTTHKLSKMIEDWSEIEDPPICMSPEFMAEGTAIKNILNPDKIVIGRDFHGHADELINFYIEEIGIEEEKIFECNIINAEMIKYTQNAFLANKISLINQFAEVCDALPESDITVIAKAIGMDNRIDPKFLRAGIGYGGSCFTKDLKAMIQFMESEYIDPIMLRSIITTNDWMPMYVASILNQMNLENIRIAILGLTFKPDTDDMRNAPSLKLIEELKICGANNIIAYDPLPENAKKLCPDIEYAVSPIEALSGAEWAIIVTEWDEIKNLKPEHFTIFMKTPNVFDCRRIYDPVKMINKGVNYNAVGLGKNV